MTVDPTDNAFPIFLADGRYNPHEAGLTKREYFAALAMQGILANPELAAGPALSRANWAVEHADALIAALSRETPSNS